MKKEYKLLCVAMILNGYLALFPTSISAAKEIYSSQIVNQQKVSVKGTIVDEAGEPIIGASIVVKGTSNGTITDVNGHFTLSVPENASMVISFIGYADQTVKAKQGTPLRVILKEDTAILDEVVVVGYGSVKRANLTGAVSNVDMKRLEDIPSTNLTAVLMGTMPGVTVSEASGSPLANATIKIRTNGTWNTEEPLYVIDGFIRDADAFNALDPSEVSSISVLKDAAAAVYGVRGAGGVLVVATKRGKEGKTHLNYSGSVGVSQGIHLPEMMNAYEQGTALNDMWNEQRRNGGTVNEQNFTTEELEEMKGLDYNWLDEAWKAALNTRHTLNVSGGSEKVRYFVGGSYVYSNGNFPDLNTNRFNVRTGLDVNFTKELKANFSVNYSNRQSELPLNKKDGSQPELMYGTFNGLNRMPRWIPAYIDGMPVGNGMTGNDTHPLEIFKSGSYKQSKSDDITLSTRFDYDIKWVKGLSANLSLNYSRSSSQGKQLAKPYTVYNFAKRTTDTGENGQLLSTTVSGTTLLQNGNKYEDGANFGYSYQLNPQLNYYRTVGKHDLSMMYVFEVAESGGNNLSISASDLLIDNYENILGFDSNKLSGTSAIKTKSRRLSHIGRLNYSYDNRYFFEGTLRYEASTNFAPEYRWGLFYSLSGSWRISEEKWFKEHVRHIDNLKIRASYGRLGNDRASLDQWQQSYKNDGVVYLFGGGGGSEVIGLRPAKCGLSAYDASWEKSDSYNVGLDMSLSNGLYFDADGFYKHTFDILNTRQSEFPEATGITGDTPQVNYGLMNAWGVELGMGYQKQFKGDWGINVRGNFSYAVNKVIRKSQSAGVVGTWQDEEGRMAGGKTGFSVWKGVDGQGDGMARNWDDIHHYIAYLKSHLAHPEDAISVFGKKEADLRPGMLLFEDRGTTLANSTPDGIIDDKGDMGIISKYEAPPFNYGLNVGFNWKSLNVSMLFSGSFGNDVLFDKNFYGAGSAGRSSDYLSLTSNQLKEWSGNYARAAEDGSLVDANAKYPRLDDYSFRDKASDFWLRDGHCLRLRTLNVSYTLPKEWTLKAKVSTCRLFFTANNLWTIINPFPYKDAYVGFWSDYPQLRTFNFGINLGF